MVRRVTSAPGGVQVVVGQAGTGKTVALAAAAEAFDSAGISVRGCALSARAALQLQHDAGIPSTTIAAVLRDLDQDRPLQHGSVLVVDECGMVDTRTLARLLTAAQQARAKLVLVGDPAQLPELAAGGLFAGLIARLHPIELRRNRRQRQPWDRDALAALRAGDPAPLIHAYQTHHRLTVAGTDADTGRRLAGDWAAWAAAQPAELLGEGVMLAARRADVDALNRHARHLLRAAGRLGADTLVAGGRGYAVGDRVVCLRNNRRVGVTNGTRATVTYLDPATSSITVQPDGDAAEVVLPGWYVTGGHVAHGYAVTVHKAQGATVDRAWVYADTRSVYAQWLYTALSRHRDTAQLYTSVTTLDQLAIEAEAHDPRPPSAWTAGRAARSPRCTRTPRAAARTPSPATTPPPPNPTPAPPTSQTRQRRRGFARSHRGRPGRSGPSRSGCRCDRTTTREQRRAALMDADDRTYEFLLSDHPAAKAERLRRRDDHLARRTADSDAITAWRARLVTFGAGVPANLHNLAETMGRIDERATLRDAAEQGEPDEVWVARARQRFTATARTWGDDPDYQYPHRYLGPAAADQPNLLNPAPPAPTRPARSAPRPEGPGLGL